jgi:hypothetical protein
MSPDGAFVETLLRNPENRLLELVDIDARSISTGRMTRELRLVQLHGSGLGRLHITVEVAHGAHPPCRALALELWKHRAAVDGIAYRSRFDNDELCIALFDRASDAVTITGTVGLRADARWFQAVIDKYDVGV